MIRQQRHGMPVMAEVFASFMFFHDPRNNFYAFKEEVRAV